MSNEKHKIDELFRQKLGNYELDAPDHVWRNIEAKRTPLHKAINYFKNKRAAITVTTLIIVTSLAYISFVQMANSTGTADENLPKIAVTAPATAGDATAANTEKTAAAETANSPAAGAPNMAANHPVATVPANNQPAGNGNNHNGSSNNGGGATANPGAATGNNNPANNTSNTVTTPNNTIETPVLKENTPVAEEAPAPTLIAEAPAAELAESEPAEQPSPETIDETKKQEKTTVKPDRLRKWSADVYASGDMAGRSLSANGISQQYINERNNTETFKPGFTFGARINYDLNKTGMLKLRAGFQYSRINEKVEFATSTTKTRIETVTGVVVDPVTGQPIGTTTRTDTIKETVTNKATAQNRYSFIDLPVQLEIGLFKSQRLNIFATGGAAINLRFTQKGSILSRDMNGIKELAAYNPYKTNAGISLLAGLGVEYKLCGNFSLLLETQYRQGVTSVFKPGEGMNQTFRVFSAGAGLRYRF